MVDPRQLYADAVAAMREEQWPQALQAAAQAAHLAPRNPQVHYVAGVAALQLQRLRLALQHLSAAATHQPPRAEYLAQYARALTMAGQIAEATAIADTAIALADADALACDTLGLVYSTANAHVRAADAFRRAVDLAPHRANYRFNLATSLMFLGRMGEAERECEACIELDPTWWPAHFSLSQLRRHDAVHNHLERLDTLIRQHPNDADAQLHLCMARGKELDDMGQGQEAFDSYAAGKAAHRHRIGSPEERDAAGFDAVRRYFERPLVGKPGDATREPIFVVGMPRSGTTLIDRILSMHPQVHSAGELSNFGIVLQQAGARRAPTVAAAVANLGPEFAAWDSLGDAYLTSTRPDTGRTPRFVDKLPHNFMYLGFIARALPNARIICLRRNPLDTCIGNFRQLFALENRTYDYSYDLLDTGRHYLRFRELMAFWHALLPGRILELDYEGLVESQEATTRSLLAFCGLEWDKMCLHFERNHAPVATASAVQVRSGMNREALYRWKRYGSRLDTLRELLEASGVDVS